MFGTLRRLDDVNPSTFALAVTPDVRASNWIKENLPKQAKFLVNSFLAYNGTLAVGSDGGIWIPLLAERSTNLPPITYGFEESFSEDYIQSTNEVISMVYEYGPTNPEVIEMLQEQNITHIYVGQRQGSVNYSGSGKLNPEELAASPNYEPLSSRSCVDLSSNTLTMNITVLTSSYPRYHGDGTAPFIKSLADNYFRLGHKVHVIAPYDPKVQAPESDGVIVHRFRYIIPKRYHIMGHAQAMEADIKLRPLSYLLLPFFMISEFVQLMRVAKATRSEIIHVHWVLPNGPMAVLASMILRIPFVLSLHGSDIYFAKKFKLFGKVAGGV
jgi:hypothetical protein